MSHELNLSLRRRKESVLKILLCVFFVSSSFCENLKERRNLASIVVFGFEVLNFKLSKISAGGLHLILSCHIKLSTCQRQLQTEL